MMIMMMMMKLIWSMDVDRVEEARMGNAVKETLEPTKTTFCGFIKYCCLRVQISQNYYYNNQMARI